MKRLNFYDIDEKYIQYLKDSELQHRGITRVPNMDYGVQDGIRVKKFLCGPVLEQGGYTYFAPVSSKIMPTSSNTPLPNTLLLIEERDERPIKGSLRFQYMIPVPLELTAVRQIKLEPHLSYQKLLFAELEIVRRNMDRVLEMAEKTYLARMQQSNWWLEHNSCDFKFLERKCREYCIAHHLEVPGGRTIVEIYQQDFKARCNHREYYRPSPEFIERLEKEVRCLIFPRGEKYLVAVHENDFEKANQMEVEYGITALTPGLRR